MPGYFKLPKTGTGVQLSSIWWTEQCVAVCKSGYYPAITGDYTNLNITSASCLTCHSSCFECRGGSSTSDCLVCYRDQYLSLINTTRGTGTCTDRSTITKTLTFTVTGDRSTSSSTTHFPTLLEAVQQAFIQSSPNKAATATINLVSHQVHAITMEDFANF